MLNHHSGSETRQNFTLETLEIVKTDQGTFVTWDRDSEQSPDNGGGNVNSSGRVMINDQGAVAM